MPDIIRIEDWHAPLGIVPIYERLLQTMGTEEFGSTVRDAVISITNGARRIYLFEATGRQDSSLHYFSCEPGVAEMFPAYSHHYMRLDPAGDCYRAASAVGDTVLMRVRPRDIASPGLRRQFFDEAGILERISIIQRGQDAWRGMNVARHLRDGELGDGELTSLVGLASAVLPMLSASRGARRPGRQLTVGQLETRFANRYPDLTEREAQVCARAAIGMSVEATAIDLGIAKTSVLTYRRRAYHRLQVTSPFELSSLVSH
jgi:DNA-binding CsgD family transcriptional regulator